MPSARELAFIDRVTLDIENFRSGGLETLPSISEWAADAGFSEKTATAYLKKRRLVREITSAQTERRMSEMFRPSRELATFIGLASSCGDVAPNHGMFVHDEKGYPSDKFSAFTHFSSKLFDTTPTSYPVNSENPTRLWLPGAEIARRVGSLTRDNWHTFVQDTEYHQWIEKGEEFKVGFLEGFFIGKMSPSSQKKNNPIERLTVYHSQQEQLKYLQKLLGEIGIESRIHEPRKGRYQLTISQQDEIYNLLQKFEFNWNGPKKDRCKTFLEYVRKRRDQQTSHDQVVKYARIHKRSLERGMISSRNAQILEDANKVYMTLLKKDVFEKGVQPQDKQAIDRLVSLLISFVYGYKININLTKKDTNRNGLTPNESKLLSSVEAFEQTLAQNNMKASEVPELTQGVLKYFIIKLGDARFGITDLCEMIEDLEKTHVGNK